MRVIYRIYCKTSKKSYIGQTRDLQERKRRHIRDSKKHKIHSKLYRAVRKYGWENFEWSILQKCRNFQTMDRAEIKWIKKLDTFNNGYNLTNGGGFGRDISEETKKLISLKNKGKPGPNLGRKFSKEIRARMSLGQRNKAPITNETRLKMSKARTGKKQPLSFSRFMTKYNKNRWKQKGYRSSREVCIKLKESEIIEIYLKTRVWGNAQKLSEKFGVSKSLIGNIKLLKSSCYRKVIKKYLVSKRENVG